MTVINNIHYDINPLLCCPSVFSLTIYDSLNPRRPHDSSKNFNIFWIFNQEIVYKVIGIYDSFTSFECFSVQNDVRAEFVSLRSP